MAPKTAKPKTVKTAKPQRTSYPIAAEAISKPQPTEKVRFAVRRLSEQYIPLVTAVLSMKQGQTITYDLPKGSDPVRARMSISQTLRKRVADDVDGRLSFRLTEDGKLAISLVKAK